MNEEENAEGNETDTAPGHNTVPSTTLSNLLLALLAFVVFVVLVGVGLTCNGIIKF